MPTAPEGLEWDFDAEGSRFTLRPAFAIAVPEQDWPEISGDDARSVVERRIGSELLKPQDPLGEAVVVDGSIGRGAGGWIPVVEFLFEPAAKGVVAAAAGKAALEIWERIRRRRKDESGDEPDPTSVLVSRGMAVLLAIAHLNAKHGREESWSLEAADEPSAIGRAPTHETNYVGIEPWVVLLRSIDSALRCVVLVAPDGAVLGSFCAPLSEIEVLYLQTY